MKCVDYHYYSEEEFINDFGPFAAKYYELFKQIRQDGKLSA